MYMAPPHFPPEWLEQYGNASEYAWRKSTTDGRLTFQRPLGLVEFSFDTDGRYFEGRADISCLLQLAITSTLSQAEVRERILLAWTRLRCQHLLLQARTVQKDDRLFFALDVAEGGVDEARDSASEHMVFLDDFYSSVDPHDFYVHCQNASRVVDASVALAKVFVLPTVVEKGQLVQRFQFVGAHMIWDGLSSYVWMRDFIQCLNESPKTLRAQIGEYIQPARIGQDAPLPQEAFYPQPFPGNPARQRWFWAITRLLRHCRKPLPVGFENPLRRATRKEPFSPPPVYQAVLDYRRTPPLNTAPIHLRIPAGKLHRLCREASASVGAGIFALVALTMMEFYEAREPEVTLEDRKCFIAGFPLDPRAFFNYRRDPDCMMLAFSDGISLPFLSSHLNLEGRLRLLARQAHRQLASYQKRSRPQAHDAKQHHLRSRGAGLVLANQYLYSHERAPSLLLRPGLTVQGQYPARPNPTTQTCGVSSVGLRDRLIRSGLFDLKDPAKDFAADFQDLVAGVRAREAEFLVGAAGTRDEILVAVSVDVSALDAELVEQWRLRLTRVLDDGGGVCMARL